MARDIVAKPLPSCLPSKKYDSLAASEARARDSSMQIKSPGLYGRLARRRSVRLEISDSSGARGWGVRFAGGLKNWTIARLCLAESRDSAIGRSRRVETIA